MGCLPLSSSRGSKMILHSKIGISILFFILVDSLWIFFLLQILIYQVYPLNGISVSEILLGNSEENFRIHSSYTDLNQGPITC